MKGSPSSVVRINGVGMLGTSTLLGGGVAA